LSDFIESYPKVNEVFTKQGWEKMLSSSVRVSPTLVHEFYSNMGDLRDGTFCSMLQGKEITISPTLIC
jgi:hypothetical protein